MNKQTQIQIACILSDIFLESALHYKDNDTIDESLTKSYYTRITNEILQICPCFSKKDLESIFPAIAYYCMHTISRWIFYDDWSSFDKEAIKRDLESQWRFIISLGFYINIRCSINIECFVMRLALAKMKRYGVRIGQHPQCYISRFYLLSSA